MSMYCGLEISTSRASALASLTRAWSYPAQAEAPIEKPIEEFFGKNALPLLWLPLFGPSDIATIRPPLGAQYKFTPQHSPIPVSALVSPVDAALDRLEHQAVRLLSFLDLNPVGPNALAFIGMWQARLKRHAGKWVTFDPGDIVPFEGDELPALLVDILKAIAGDTPDASLLSTIQDVFGSPFANRTSPSAREIVEVWYHELAGGLDDDESDWPPEPTLPDLAAAEAAMTQRPPRAASKPAAVGKASALNWWQRFLGRS